MGELVGAVVWIMANVMYVQYRRDDLRGFKRFAAFWLGFPITVISAFGVAGPSADRRIQLALEAQREAQEDGVVEAALLDEIRRDRASRGLGAGGSLGSEGPDD